MSTLRDKNMKRINNKKLAESFINEQIKLIKKEVGNKKVLLALSGGVDSSVVAALLYKAINKNLICVHVDHGLLRLGESEEVIKVFKNKFHTNLIYSDSSKIFLNALKGVNDPEKKRKIIGKVFIDVFAKEAKKLKGISYLAQGTIYPDILESKGVKAHHNVGGLPKELNFKLIEPLKLLYKDEVRQVGLALGLPSDMVYRQPFPGPGLGVRCLGAITLDRLNALKESDKILRDEFKKAGLDKKVWQYFTIVPEGKSTGVINGKRLYGYVCVIRAVNTIDALKASIEEIPYPILNKISKRILTEVKNINRVVYDITPKPIGTIEWE